MDKTKVKLCGMMKKEDIVTCNRLMPDYVGFIFVKNSKRYICKEDALDFKALLDSKIATVGVFKDQSLDEIFEIANLKILHMIQLHGSETNDFIKAVRDKCDLPIIKAFGINDEADIQRANESIADFVLLDTLGGGSGNTFNHSLLKGIKREFFLAGGLDDTNVEGLIKRFQPFAVDVSSGIETKGKKDPKKMSNFVYKVKNNSFNKE